MTDILFRQEVSTFAQLVRLPDLEFAADDESSILMTVTTMLSIMIPPSKTRPITYLDVPLDRITEISPVKLDSQSQARSQHSQSQTIRPCCLEIGLNNLQGWNHVLNAKSRHADSVVVLFDYTQDAKMIHDAILARRSTPFQTVSPGDLEYEGKASNEEAIIHESDPIMLDLPEIDTGEVAATHVNQLAAMASDAISRVPCSGASNDVHERSVDVGYDGRTNVNGPQPSGTQNQLALNNTDGIGDSVREMVPANHDSNIGRPRAPTNPSLEAKQNAPLDNGASGGAGNSINTRDRQHTQQSAMQSPSLGHPRQKEDDYNSMYDLSPLKPKGKPLAQATMMPAVEGLTTNQHTDSSRRGSRKLSRQLRDRNGKVQDIDHGQCLTAEVPFVQSDKSLHQRTLEQRSSSTTIKPKASNIGTSRKVGMKAKLVGQQRKALPVSTHDEEYTPTVTTGHKATRVVQAPKAKMVAGSKKREPRKPSNVSASSDPRPDLKDQAAGISQTVSPSKAKFQHSVAVEEEEVDWSEDLQVDYSDITTKAKKKKTLQPQASQVRVQEKKKSLQPEARAAKVSEKKKTLQPQARATKTQERKLTPTQQRKEVPSRPTVNVQSSKPKRAAALKASTKIQGLSDNFKKKQSPIKDAATKESFKPTPVSDGAVSAAKIGKSGLDTSALQTRSDTSPKNFSPSSSAYTRGPFPTIKAPKEKAIADFSSQKTAESIRERDPTPKPVATSVAAKDKSVEPRAMSKSEHVGHISIDHGLDQEVVGDSLPANEEAAQPIFEASVEQDNLNNLMHHTEGNMAANTIDFNQLSELYNADSSPSPMVQQVLIAPMDTGNVPGAIIPAPSSNARVQAEIQGVHEKRRAVSPPARSVSLPDPLAERYIDAKVKSGKHPGPQDDHCSKNRQHQQVITQADAPQLGEMDHQNQSEFEDGSKKSPPAPKKKRFTASMLQAALSPLLVLPTRKPDQNSAPITQVVNELADHVEQETVAKANGAISILNVPIARKRHAKQKRYLEEDDTRQSKKSRASGWKPSSGPYSARSIIVTPKDSGSNVHRKPRLVHFGSDGPKNQGIQSAQKDAMRDGSRSREKQIDMPHELALSSKRKHVSLTDEQCIAADSTPNEKRRKMNAEKPSLSWKEEDRTVAQRPDKSIATGGYGKPSSQSSRVTEHGSPMPFHHSRRASLRAPVATLALHEASDEEPIACQTDINNELEPQLPIAAPYHKLPSIPEPKIIVASNTKHRPSSPNAPSSIVTDMAAHRVQPSGHFVEIQTNSVVVPTNPQDPFTGATKDRPYNHFTETLRKSGDMQSKETKQSRNEQHEKKIPSDGRKDDDPDKTLIGESLSEDERKSSTASGSSSGSNSSESPGEADVEPSDNGSDPGSEWLRGLRADHRDTLDALYEINHVCHLFPEAHSSR